MLDLWISAECSISVSVSLQCLVWICSSLSNEFIIVFFKNIATSH